MISSPHATSNAAAVILDELRELAASGDVGALAKRGISVAGPVDHLALLLVIVAGLDRLANQLAVLTDGPRPRRAAPRA